MIDTPGSPSKRKSTGKGLGGVLIAGTTLLFLGGAALALAGGGGGGGDDLPEPLIPSGPITDAEREACEQVLAMKPQPTSYKDDQGRVWTPCVEWWLGKNIPNWPPGIWPGQVPFLYKPVDAADWLGVIAGYLVYKGPLTTAATETFTDEAATVEITKLLTQRREVLRAYMTQRLGELKRPNAANDCAPCLLYTSRCV